LIIAALKARYPGIHHPPSEDICYATTNRQQAVSELAPATDLVLVVGSRNSSNSVRLTEISRNRGTPAHLVDDVTEIQSEWFDGVQSVLITAGASAPEHLVQEIVQTLVERHDGQVEETHVVEERMYFGMPMSLRVLRNAAKAAPETA